MKDTAFIHEMLQRGNAATDKVSTEFSALSLSQLNWKPAPESWSVGQCLDHLIVSNRSYFPAFERAGSAAFSMTAWERWSPFSGIFGKLLVNQVQENVKTKMKAPKIFVPSESSIDPEILGRFNDHQGVLLKYITSFEALDIDQTRITSPPVHFITYSLRHAVQLIVQHEHRHINQAIRVKHNASFPNAQ
jgi:hypothetical protein